MNQRFDKTTTQFNGQPTLIEDVPSNDLDAVWREAKTDDPSAGAKNAATKNEPTSSRFNRD